MARTKTPRRTKQRSWEIRLLICKKMVAILAGRHGLTIAAQHALREQAIVALQERGDFTQQDAERARDLAGLVRHTEGRPR